MTTGIMIPICVVCNNVKDVDLHEESEQWGSLYTYLAVHGLSSGDYLLTHTYCPDCSRQLNKLSHGYESQSASGFEATSQSRSSIGWSHEDKGKR